jgi:predicted DsbA family dithiol-disulfide isomerase|tara:strand:+ start:1847 stop:2047 length:201 start_codon:yes stop_codon:yes gene_type:complete
MAAFTEKVVAEVIEVQEFPDIGNSYQVKGVPLTVINEKYSFTGAANEQMLLEHLKNALSELPEGEY